MKFKISFKGKDLIFDSEIRGLVVDGKEYVAGEDGVLIYDQTDGIKSEKVTMQMSTNTSTLIPALRILGLPYNNYFDERVVIESQNNITFYWKPSLLAAYYNKFSTDLLGFEDREAVIRKATDFLVNSRSKLGLKEEILSKVEEECRLLGFFEGFPIFDNNFGMPKLLSRLGIHVGTESIMVSTPLDKYSEDVYELSEILARETGESYSGKKNRCVFEKSEKLLRILNIKKHPH